MLKSLTLNNWKSFGERRNRLDLASLTLLVGPNGSGKSNALDALRFLQGAALDFPLGDVLRGRFEGQREIWPPIRGQVVEAARGGLASFRLETEWQFAGLGVGGNLRHAIAIDTREDALLDSERLGSSPDIYAFDTHAPTLKNSSGRQAGGAMRVALRTKGKGNSVAETYSAARSLLGQVAEGGRVNPTAIAEARRVQSELRGIAFLDIQPSRMRDYRPEHAHSLGTSAENISPKLRALSSQQLDDVVGWVSELCAPNLSAISFDVTQLKEVMFYLDEQPATKVSARSVSDGTLRFLGLVTALLTSEPGSFIVLEEPDVGLHPARIHLLAQLLEQATADNRLQVLATTHSPTLLAHLAPASLANVVALGRDDEGMTVCERVGDLDHFEILRDSEQLDRLVSTGWIERAL
ncbi:MAG TPA: AAA family ATPase [Rhodanobacteraceae bacterium]|nr:AAA family ATPase [Rhodanobacteraceae bacterium]